MDVAGLRAIFSSRIRKLREGKMNQGEFADSVGISRGAMSYYEQELRTPDIGVLRAICEKYKVSADYLLGLMPDTNHAVSDVCIETGLWPKVARRLMLIERLKNTKMKPNIVEAVFEEFDQEAQEVLELSPFTGATPMMNLLVSTDEGLHLLNMLSAIIFGAELQIDDVSVAEPKLKLMTNHRNIEIQYPLENITAALWVNIQREVERLKVKVDAPNAEHPE
jgi:transcriptional regulator with XRE-family HTH domain